MWGKPADASVQETNDWFAVPLEDAEDCPMAVVGPFKSQSSAWDWLEECVQAEKAGGGWVFQATAPAIDPASFAVEEKDGD